MWHQVLIVSPIDDKERHVPEDDCLVGRHLLADSTSTVGTSGSTQSGTLLFPSPQTCCRTKNTVILQAAIVQLTSERP